jgi:hypothetical protein
MCYDRAVIEALRDASSHGMKVRVRRDASEAARPSEFDVEAQLGGRVQGLEIRSSAPGGELMHLNTELTIAFCAPARPISADLAKRPRTTTS